MSTLTIDVEAALQALAAMPDVPAYTGVPDALDEQLWPGTGWTRMPINPPVVPAPSGTPCNHCGRTGLDLTFWPPTENGRWTCASHHGCWCDKTDCCGGE